MTAAAGIETFDVALPSGIVLSCRAAGDARTPTILLLHGFPEAAFVWDDVMRRLAPRFRCVAPNLRGYERSSRPVEVEAYRVKHLIGDIENLVRALGGHVAAVVAHDWGGACAWSFAAQHASLLDKLVIVNSPHPATFLRELQTNPQQQQASRYMNFLCRPDAEALLAESDFARLWPFFTNMGAAAWLDEPTRDRYRAVWSAGLTGGLNYYRASPLKPAITDQDAVRSLSFPPEMVTVRVPTHVVWAELDIALLPSLLDGLDAFVPDLAVTRVAEATHWIVHEQPELIAGIVERFVSP